MFVLVSGSVGLSGRLSVLWSSLLSCQSVGLPFCCRVCDAGLLVYQSPDLLVRSAGLPVRVAVVGPSSVRGGRTARQGPCFTGRPAGINCRFFSRAPLGEAGGRGGGGRRRPGWPASGAWPPPRGRGSRQARPGPAQQSVITPGSARPGPAKNTGPRPTWDHNRSVVRPPARSAARGRRRPPGGSH